MKRLLVFGGTSDSRRLIEALTERPVALTVSVVTSYGASLVPAHDRIALHTGSLDQAGMIALLQGDAFVAVVDATHPYASEASRNIRAAAEACGLPCLRLLREAAGEEGLAVYPTVEAAVAAIVDTEGAVLAATGSKELHRYTVLPNYADRVCPRVLPTVEAVSRCAELGFSPGRIIAMQGPFAYELNLALMRRFAIRYMVTKDGGTAGGFSEKVDAAREVGAEVLLVARPPESGGFDRDGLLLAIDTLLEVKA